MAETVPNPSPLANFLDVRLAGMAAKKNPGGSLNCGSAELGLVLAIAIDNWQLAPLCVLLVPLVVVRISFASLRRPFMDFGKTLNE
jgi:hypothetical protein